MVTPGPQDLLHVIGYLTGATLYGMLLAMALRTRGVSDRLTAATALLGLAWNVGDLAAHVLSGLGLPAARDWMLAAAYGALGLLGAVAVHAAAARGRDAHPNLRLRRAIPAFAYLCATVAALLHAVAAATGAALPSAAGLVLLTTGLGIVAVPLFVTTRRQTQGRRTLWMMTLALFAVSALHVGRFHLASEGWLTELLGHHSSIPLAFAILYEDYRFALADLFLKRALTLLGVVTLVLLGWMAIASTFLANGQLPPEGVAALLAAWVATALVFPYLQRGAGVFVDRVILRRTGYATLIDEVATTAQRRESADEILGAACSQLARGLGADTVTWEATTTLDEHGAADHGRAAIPVPTAESPYYRLSVGRLAGGRRLLSDDLDMLERVAFLLARRIDALRITEERYEAVLREREIGALVTEAELRALRAQINPHFLFNSLTTIGYLIQHAPARAVETLLHLTTLLRGALRPDGEFTTLGHERALLECYLQIEAARFEERLQVAIDIPAALSHLTIPSLLVQPLVENAIKHGIAPSRHGGALSVTASLEPGTQRLRIAVRNTGRPFTGRQSAAGEGVGLTNVERRLRCYYEDAATFRLDVDDSGATLAELVLPAGQPAEAPAPVLAGRR